MSMYSKSRPKFVISDIGEVLYQCACCRSYLARKAFYKRKQPRYGLSSRCIACTKGTEPVLVSALEMELQGNG